MFAVVIVIVNVPDARATNVINVQTIGATHRPIPMVDNGDRSWICGIVDNMSWVA